MRITMCYLGGPYDGDVVFDTSNESPSPEQSLAMEHYRLSDQGLVGSFFVAGTSKGRAAVAYRVIACEESENGRERIVTLAVDS